VGVVTLLLGSTAGYLYATQVAFPGDVAETGVLLEVPDLRGGTEAEARRLLEDRNLAMGRVDSIRHPTVPVGQVVGQTPFPGQLALPGGEVELAVSQGPERRPVPDVTRLRADRALTVLRTTGFEVVVDSVDADEPAGRVIATDPSVGTTATLPSEIRMTVSLGPPMVEMPDLTGRQEVEAREALEELGLTVGEVQTRFQFGFGRGEVLGTTPEAGEMVPRGGEVHLEVASRGFQRDDDGGRP
jgi:eukaryotic-like serine/threonine-protein kinase